MNQLDKIMLVVSGVFLILIVIGFSFGVLEFKVSEPFLDDNVWEKKFQCIEYNSVYELEGETYGCKLDCERISTKSGTDVDRCRCELNNETVYRYCRSKMPVYEYIGVKNESNLLSID